MWQERFNQWLSNIEMWDDVLYACIRIVIVIALSRMITTVIYKIIDRYLQRREIGRLQTNERRTITIGKLLKNVTRIAANGIVIMLIVGELGFHMGPLLAGAGVIGLAIGFGAQSLVKDIITGFFIILEDQFAVGDVVQIGTLKGTVEIIGLRSTRLISWTGEVHIIPNGTITNVTNYSIGTSLAVVDVPLAVSHKVEEMIRLLSRAMQELKEQQPELNHEPRVLGVQSQTSSEYVVRIAAECKPDARSTIERQIQQYVREVLEQQYRE